MRVRLRERGEQEGGRPHVIDGIMAATKGLLRRQYRSDALARKGERRILEGLMEGVEGVWKLFSKFRRVRSCILSLPAADHQPYDRVPQYVLPTFSTLGSFLASSQARDQTTPAAPCSLGCLQKYSISNHSNSWICFHRFIDSR